LLRKEKSLQLLGKLLELLTAVHLNNANNNNQEFQQRYSQHGIQQSELISLPLCVLPVLVHRTAPTVASSSNTQSSDTAVLSWKFCLSFLKKHLCQYACVENKHQPQPQRIKPQQQRAGVGNTKILQSKLCNNDMYLDSLLFIISKLLYSIQSLPSRKQFT
jgi:hypothetical protein